MSVLLLADSFGRATAWATRIGVGIFLVIFSAYDTPLPTSITESQRRSVAKVSVASGLDFAPSA
jgi:hypothetical protein